MNPKHAKPERFELITDPKVFETVHWGQPLRSVIIFNESPAAYWDRVDRLDMAKPRQEAK